MSKERMCQQIEKAQHEVEKMKELVKKGEMRQHYHFMPQTGWLNDPNGLIYFRGKYHFFFQYNPYHGFWDSMHWGHAVSEDLVHWEYLPTALAPSESYDDHLKGGCFSGSAIEKDGKLFLVYTGTTNRGRGYEQVQCVAFSEDGVVFEKYEGNPVITAPEGVPLDEFRDPKVWKHGDCYYLLVAACRDQKGMALIYRSENLLDWEYLNVFLESRGEWGRMWECPDIFPLGEKYVLTFSPVGSGDHTAVSILGEIDYETGRFYPEKSQEIDWGLDFYAPQSLETPDGRRILTAWANEWEWMPFFKDWGPTFKEGWCGFFNLPREIRRKEDGTLQYVPIRELENLREQPFYEEKITVGEDAVRLHAGDGISCEMKFRIDLEHTTAEKVELDLRCGSGRKTVCMFDLKNGTFCVDRENSDGWSVGNSRNILKLRGKKELDVHIFSDQSSIEIFLEEYTNNHANNVFASNDQKEILIRAYGGQTVLTGYESYGMKDCFNQ